MLLSVSKSRWSSRLSLLSVFVDRTVSITACGCLLSNVLATGSGELLFASTQHDMLYITTSCHRKWLLASKHANTFQGAAYDSTCVQLILLRASSWHKSHFYTAFTNRHHSSFHLSWTRPKQHDEIDSLCTRCSLYKPKARTSHYLCVWTLHALGVTRRPWGLVRARELDNLPCGQVNTPAVFRTILMSRKSLCGVFSTCKSDWSRRQSTCHIEQNLERMIRFMILTTNAILRHWADDLQWC